MGTVTEKKISELIAAKSGTQIIFSGEEGKEIIKILTPGKAEIILDDEKKTIVAKRGKSEIEINEKDGIILRCGKTVNIEAENITLKAKNKIALSGADVEIKANAGFKVQSSGIAEVKGSMVKING
jgi:hypothetical protein